MSSRQVFTSSGTFTPDPGVTAVDVLIIGGGGAGGAAGSAGGGGGAGQVRWATGVAVSGPVSVTVGAGAPQSVTGPMAGASGAASSFGALTAAGGGGGGGGSVAAMSGASGGGGSGGGSSAAVGTAGGDGGAGATTQRQPVGRSGGGGGGAGGDGITPSPTTQTSNIVEGDGGPGVSLAALDVDLADLGITGWVAGGGGGGREAYHAKDWHNGAGGGGAGGGGRGGIGGSTFLARTATAGAANTGSGGGGSPAASAPNRIGGAGGSGLVVVLWEEDPGPPPVPAPSASALTNPTGRWVKGTLRSLWHDGTHWAGVLPTAEGHYLYPDLGDLSAPGGRLLDTRQAARPTVAVSDDGAYVLMGHPSSSVLHVLSISAGYDEVRTSVCPLTAADLDASPIALLRTGNGTLWAAVVEGGNVRVSRSTNNGVSWSAAESAALPGATTGTVAMAETGGTVVMAIALNDGVGHYVYSIASTAPSVALANWAAETLPALPAGVTSDDHLTMAALWDGRVMLASKTSDATTSAQPVLYSAIRSTGGAWTMQTIEPGPDTGVRYTRPVLTVAGASAIVHYGSIGDPKSLTARTMDLTAASPSWSARVTVVGGPDYSDSTAAPDIIASPAVLPWPIVTHQRTAGALEVRWETLWADLPRAYLGAFPVEMRLGGTLVAVP